MSAASELLERLLEGTDLTQPEAELLLGLLTDGTAAPAMIGRVLAALRATLADPRGRWILCSAHREAASERALSGLAEGRLRSIVIDRSFIDAEGVRWVIDFKTSVHEGAGLEEFLDSEVQRYRGQLAAYAALARGLGAQPVRAGLYFPLLGVFRPM